MMANLRHLVCVIVLISGMVEIDQCLTTVPDDDNSWTLPENTPFTVALLFSGDTSENVTACPWIFETNTSDKIIGPNKEFMEYFSQDLSEEIAAYPQIVKIVDIKYTATYNWFTDESQRDPDHRWVIRDGKNVSTFDPYYCLLWFRFDSSTNISTLHFYSLLLSYVIIRYNKFIQFLIRNKRKINSLRESYRKSKLL